MQTQPHRTGGPRSLAFGDLGVNKSSESALHGPDRFPVPGSSASSPSPQAPPSSSFPRRGAGGLRPSSSASSSASLLSSLPSAAAVAGLPPTNSPSPPALPSPMPGTPSLNRPSWAARAPASASATPFLLSEQCFSSPSLPTGSAPLAKLKHLTLRLRKLAAKTARSEAVIAAKPRLQHPAPAQAKSKSRLPRGSPASQGATAASRRRKRRNFFPGFVSKGMTASAFPRLFRKAPKQHH